MFKKNLFHQSQGYIYYFPTKWWYFVIFQQIGALSPFAVQLDFLVEEYAAGKGLMPPKKRRRKNSIYIATIEKGLALIRSLIELDRLHEIGLIVVSNTYKTYLP